MNKFYLVAAVVALAACATVQAEEVGSVTATVTDSGVAVKLNAGPSAATPTAKEKWEEAERKREERGREAARRSGLSFWEARGEDAAATWNGVKWGACKTAQGAANADGYVAACVAVPTGYVAGSAFSAASSCSAAAASIK